MDESKFFCPICEQEIDSITCFEISLHIEGGGPLNCFTDDTDVKQAESRGDECLRCKYHPT